MDARHLLMVPSLLAGLSACAGGGALEASIELPPVEISAADATKELHFRAQARTSDRVATGLVRIIVNPGHSSGDGQVRVTVYRGPDAVTDPAPENGVIPCAAEMPIAVLREAMSGCDGTCTEHFVVVFAAEGLPEDPVALPVVVEAELVYEHAEQTLEGDFLRLTLE